MSTFSHPLQPAQARRLMLVPKEPCRRDDGLRLEEQITITMEDDGLGSMRAVAAAFVCTLILGLLAGIAWEVWHLLWRFFWHLLS